MCHPPETWGQITTLRDVQSAQVASRATDPDPSAETISPAAASPTMRSDLACGNDERHSAASAAPALNPQPGQLVAHQDALHQTSPGSADGPDPTHQTGIERSRFCVGRCRVP